MIVGIDLGTSNSLIAFWDGDNSKLIPNAQGQFLTPSVVSLDASGHIVVGKPAMEQLKNHHQLSLANFKRFMGTNKVFSLGKQTFRAEELSALVLKKLVMDAEIDLKIKITEAVITVPAYFNDAQRKATRLAGELAGLKVERLLNEPTAAALAYGLHHRESETKFLIFDLGGGTFDVSVVELFNGIIEVRSSAGDNRLGGEDFTDLLEEHIHVELFDRYQIHYKTLDPKTQAKWRHEIQMLLHQLSNKEEACFHETYNGKTVDIVVTRNQFNVLVKPLFERIKIPLEKAMRDARILPEELDLVILVGGATRMPIVGKEVAKMFGKFPNSILHPDEAVALGAAVQAALKERHQDLNDVVITDVCPYSLGTNVVRESRKGKFTGLRFLPIIERNTTIPTSRMVELATVYNNQTSVHIPVYQGESYLVEENIKIGELSINLPPRPAGEETLEVRYSYDINGLLEVDVIVCNSGKRTNLTINNQNYELTQKEIESSLEKLKQIKIHPRDQFENRKILAELENLFSFFKGEDRELIADALKDFHSALDTQEQGIIEKMQKKILNFISSYKSIL